MKNPNKGVLSISWDYMETLLLLVRIFRLQSTLQEQTPWYNSLCPLFRESPFSGSLERSMHKWCWNNQNLNCHEWIVKNYEKYWSIIRRVENQSDLYKSKIECGELSKKLKSGLKTIHCTLPSCQKIITVPTILSWYQLAISQGSALWSKLLGNKRIRKSIFTLSYKIP